MFCSNCGKKLYDDAKFCHNCGYKVVIMNSSNKSTISELNKERDTVEKIIDFGLQGCMRIDPASCTFSLELFEVKSKIGLFSCKVERGANIINRRYQFSKLLSYVMKDDVMKHRASKEGEKFTGRPELTEKRLCVDIVLNDLSEGPFTIEYGTFYSLYGENEQAYQNSKKEAKKLIATLEYIKAHANDTPIDSLYNVVLIDCDRRGAFLNALREVKKMGVFEAAAFVNNLPAEIAHGVSSSQANVIKSALEKIGGKIELNRYDLY